MGPAGGSGGPAPADREGFTGARPPERPDVLDRGTGNPGGGNPGGGNHGGPGGEMPAFAPNGGGADAMGSADVKLQYVDDAPDSYSNIFDSAKTDVSAADQARLIQSLKKLGAGEELERVLDMDQVLRYFAVHNFVVNGDGYTGPMVHNYYLYEQDGQLSMIPWDYNLAFGTFQAADASAAVNDPIDTPLSISESGDRPMIDWIFARETYTQLYHQYLFELLEQVDCAAIIQEAYDRITPYVEQDPTKFCTCEEFEAGVDALQTFCRLRAESVSGQLAGTIPSTNAGQDSPETLQALADASELTLSDMGSMNAGGFGSPGSAPRKAGGMEIPKGSKR